MGRDSEMEILTLEELAEKASTLDTLQYLAYWRSQTAKTPELVFHHLMNCINLHDWSLIDFTEIETFLGEAKLHSERDAEYLSKIKEVYERHLKRNVSLNEKLVEVACLSVPFLALTLAICLIK